MMPLNAKLLHFLTTFGVDTTSIKSPLVSMDTYEIYAAVYLKTRNQMYIKIKVYPEESTQELESNFVSVKPHDYCPLKNKMTTNFNNSICKDVNIVHQEQVGGHEVTIYSLNISSSRRSSEISECGISRNNSVGASFEEEECNDYFDPSNESLDKEPYGIINSEEKLALSQTFNSKEADANNKLAENTHIKWVEQEKHHLQKQEALKNKDNSSLGKNMTTDQFSKGGVKNNGVKRSIGHILCSNGGLPKSPMPYFAKSQNKKRNYDQEIYSLGTSRLNTPDNKLQFLMDRNFSGNSLYQPTDTCYSEEGDDEYEEEEEEDEEDDNGDLDNPSDSNSECDSDEYSEIETEDDLKNVSCDESVEDVLKTKSGVPFATPGVFIDQIPRHKPVETSFQLGKPSENLPFENNLYLLQESQRCFFPRTPVPTTCRDTIHIRREVDSPTPGSKLATANQGQKQNSVCLNINQASMLSRRKDKIIHV